MSRQHKVLLAAVAAPLIAIAFVVAAWAVDVAALNGGVVSRNVVLAGRDVGGSTRAQLRSTVQAMAKEFPPTEVRIDAGDVHLTSTAGDLGLGIDVDASVERVWAIGRNDPLPTRPVRWVRSLVSPRSVDAAISIDAGTLTKQLTALEGDKRTEPVEPSASNGDAGLVLVPGRPGVELTTNAVASALPAGVQQLGRPIDLDVKRAVTHPRMTDAAVQSVIDRANAVTTDKVTLRVGDSSFQIDAAKFRPAMAVTVGGTPETPVPQLSMDPKAVGDLLAANLPAGSGNPTGVRFTMQGAALVPVAGHDAPVCCSPDAPQRIVDGLLAGTKDITLPTRTMTAAEGVTWANGLGVKQVVGEFTTYHPAGQPRVSNIHTIANAIAGTLIAPGDTFSVNAFIGKRTPEKGYVMAPVIENGQHAQDYGGGISQFATTLFNAAFFGGLDIPDHKAHSEYISRYPFGREATLAYPTVDLKIHNNTPYGVVIWPSYTDSSITVQLWSTPFATGAQTAQNPSSGCGKITTQRTRTYVDGHTDQQEYYASYKC
ncbi:MAG: VanW family protein [Actinobacteria bacterium]|nr:VanW family protein [Actinomycetota bacterium]